METDDFEWDDDKASACPSRHGVSFEEATYVFDDPDSIDEPDDRFIYGEERWNLMGFGETELLVVAYTMRGERVRIISVRRPDPHERERYDRLRSKT